MKGAAGAKTTIAVNLVCIQNQKERKRILIRLVKHISILIMIMWISLAVICAVLFGIFNDQITVTISPEYYSVFKHEQFALVLEQFGLIDAPTRVQAVVIGTVATWWYGLFLGIVLGICGMIGRCSPISTRGYLRAVAWVMLVTLGISFASGTIAFILEPAIKPDVVHWPFLTGIQNTRAAFAVGWWHNGAYLGALVATTMASLRVQKQRRVSNTLP